MKRLLIVLSVVAAVTTITLAQVDSALARHWCDRHRYRPTYVAWAAGPYYAGCRIGWWQGVVYGHVRPHWGVYCR